MGKKDKDKKKKGKVPGSSLTEAKILLDVARLSNFKLLKFQHI